MGVPSINDLSPRTIAITRSLIQPIQLQLDPLAMVDEVLSRIIFTSPIDTPADYVAALDEALGSKAPLAALLPEYHPEVVLRRFLAELRRRIVTPAN